MEEAIADLLGHDEDAILETLQILDPVNYLSQFLKSNTRPSSRPLHTTRPTTVLPSTLTRNTNGSALIRMGETRVLAGTSLLIGKPSPSSPSCGDLTIHLDMGPMCHAKYNTNQRISQLEYKWNANYHQQSLDKQRAIESWLMRTLVLPSRQSNFNSDKGILDLEQLGIETHKSAWRIVVSVVVLNYDGNVEDAALLAVVAALKDTLLPPSKVVRDESGNEVIALNTTELGSVSINEQRQGKMLKLNYIPIPLTIGFFLMNEDGTRNRRNMNMGGNIGRNKYKMLIDPTAQEEQVLDGIMSIVIAMDEADIGKDSTKKMNILSVNKPGGRVVVKAQDIAACMHLCKGRAMELTPILAKIGQSDQCI